MRPLTLAMARALKSDAPLVIFAEINHPSGPGQFWSGLGKKDWNGNSWTGAGKLGAITAVQQSSNIAIQEINFTLSGVDSDVLAQLSDDVRNLSGRAWLSCLDDKGNVVADPYQFVDSELDYQNLNVANDGTASVTITARMGFYTLDRGLDEAWTSQNQKLTYPNDTGLDMIPSLQNLSILWTPT